MILAFIVGLLIGFLMCIPIGPLNVWVINTHLRKSAARALSVAAGGSAMDFAYFLVILSGLSLFEFNNSVLFYLKVLGIVLIFLLGVKEVVSKISTEEQLAQAETPQGMLKAFITGMAIYTSNPTLIITMTALGAFIKSLEFFPFTLPYIISTSFALGIGSFLWFLFLVKVVDRYQETIRKKYLKSFVRISGILMIGLSLFMGSRLYVKEISDAPLRQSTDEK